MLIRTWRIIKKLLPILIILFIMASAAQFYLKYKHENKILKDIISRLEADSRIAQVLVSGVNYDENTKKSYTTIKFLEYDSKGLPLEPRYFTFSGNIIQFQSLVVRFDDIYVKRGDRFKGKSAYIFWKVFMLDGKDTQEYAITDIDAIPEGYKVEGLKDNYEERFWKNFWLYALDPNKAKEVGIKNAQIEAPGTMFIPGVVYTIKIEHDGGMRIDTSPIPTILRGENIP